MDKKDEFPKWYEKRYEKLKKKFPNVKTPNEQLVEMLKKY
jgi:hypothetical protein